MPNPQPLIYYHFENDGFILIFISETTSLPNNMTNFPMVMHIVQGSKHAQPPFICIHSHLFLQIGLCWLLEKFGLENFPDCSHKMLETFMWCVFSNLTIHHMHQQLDCMQACLKHLCIFESSSSLEHHTHLSF